MTKQEQEQKKMEMALNQQRKVALEKRFQKLAEKELVAREWKAEVDIMDNTMRYFAILPDYTALIESQQKQPVIEDADIKREEPETQGV